MSRQMARLAQHDALTGLPNRLLLNDRLTRAIALGRRRQKPVAVGFLDVDGSKGVNDSLGHADEVRLGHETRHHRAVRRPGLDTSVH
jgi:diguanylate cyclase (GGDEF)-like protein